MIKAMYGEEMYELGKEFERERLMKKIKKLNKIIRELKQDVENLQYECMGEDL